MVSGDVSGDILNIGPISNKVAPAVPKLAVQKMGASSCLTQGTIQTINFSTAQIQYADECNSNSGTANFVNQIVVKAASGNFAIPGDSGSLVVTTGTCPRPVGLLFAADNAGDVFVNPIKAGAGRLWCLNRRLAALLTTSADAALVSPDGDDANSAADETANDDSVTEEAAAFRECLRHDDARRLISPSQPKRATKKICCATADVAGVGVGASDEAGRARQSTFTSPQTLQACAPSLPDNLEGLPVNVIVSGPIHAL